MNKGVLPFLTKAEHQSLRAMS